VRAALRRDMPSSPWAPLRRWPCSWSRPIARGPHGPRAEARPADPVAIGSRLPRLPLVIGCGALAAELVELTRRAGLPAMDLACLPAALHDRPERIPGAVAARIRRARADGYDRIFVAYADCGTGGMLDLVLATEGVARLDGAHCYEVYAGRAAFAALADEEPGTFYLTDFLARNFERLVIRGLGLDRHPELLPIYFGNYRRLVYLAQTDDAALTDRAAAGAQRLGLAFERRLVGLGGLAPAMAGFAGAAASGPDTSAGVPLAARPSSGVLVGPVRAFASPGGVEILHSMTDSDDPASGRGDPVADIRQPVKDSARSSRGRVRNARSMKADVGMRLPTKVRDRHAAAAATRRRPRSDSAATEARA